METLGEARRTVFQDLCREHEPDLRRAARRLCRGDDDRAQDLVQETLLRACQACVSGRYREGFNTYAWLLRILTNLAINEYHRRQRQQILPLDALTSSGESGPAETHAPPADVPGVALLARALDEELEQALAELSAGLRSCVVLVDLEGLEYAEAARALRVPIGTVRSRLSRARVQLHGLLRGYARERRIA